MCLADGVRTKSLQEFCAWQTGSTGIVGRKARADPQMHLSHGKQAVAVVRQ